MSGASLPDGSKRARRSLDATLNVVPAIDLLACCISFLLFTAVWTQVSRLQVAPIGSGELSPETQPQKTLTVTVTVGPRGYVLATSAGAQVEIPVSGKDSDGAVQYDVKSLAEKLKKLKGEFPDQSAVTVAADDTVLYADLVHTIDACIGAGLSNISVMGAV